MGQSDTLDTPVESDESYEASEALLNTVRTQTGEAKSVTFGGSEFPPSGGFENGVRRIV
jgi:hypothetical protein